MTFPNYIFITSDEVKKLPIGTEVIALRNAASVILPPPPNNFVCGEIAGIFKDKSYPENCIPIDFNGRVNDWHIEWFGDRVFAVVISNFIDQAWLNEFEIEM